MLLVGSGEGMFEAIWYDREKKALVIFLRVKVTDSNRNSNIHSNYSIHAKSSSYFCMVVGMALLPQLVLLV